MGIMIPVLPNLVRQMVGEGVVHSFHGHDYAIATIWTGVFASSWGALQFFFSPIQGMVSDRFGRRAILLVSIFGLSIDYLFMALSPTIWWLFVGRLINGITSASFSTAGAYITDVTPPEERAKAFGFMGAAFGAGFLIGPIIGGLLGDPHQPLPFLPAMSDHLRMRLPFYFAAALGIINWLYGFFVLPESLPPEKREPRFNWAKANPFGSFRLLSRHPDLLGMAGVILFFQMAQFVYPSVFILLVGFRYGWNASHAAYLMAGVGLCNIIVQIFLTGPAVRRFGERGILLIGLTAGLISMVMYALAPTGLWFLAAVPVAALFGFVNSGLQGLMTRRVEPWEQGQLQGANSAIGGIVATITPQLYTNIFAWSIVVTGGAIGWRNLGQSLVWGSPILLAAAFVAIALVLAAVVARPVAETESSTT